MSAVVTLLDTRTGQRHQVVDQYFGTDADGIDAGIWKWTDGNWSCDCNRELDLARAGVPGYPYDVNGDTCGEFIELEKIEVEGRQVYP